MNADAKISSIRVIRSFNMNADAKISSIRIIRSFKKRNS